MAGHWWAAGVWGVGVRLSLSQSAVRGRLQTATFFCFQGPLPSLDLSGPKRMFPHLLLSLAHILKPCPPLYIIPLLNFPQITHFMCAFFLPRP